MTIKGFVKISIGSGLVFILGFYAYLENGISLYYSEEEQVEILNEVRSTPALPNLFFDVYEKYFGDYGVSFDAFVFQTFRNEVTGNNDRSICHSLDAARNMRWVTQNAKPYHSAPVLAKFLENEVSPEVLFSYVYSQHEYSRFRGVREASMTYYNVPVEQLNERQVLELFIIGTANTKYNPIRNPTNLKRKVDKLVEKANKNDK